MKLQTENKKAIFNNNILKSNFFKLSTDQSLQWFIFIFNYISIMVFYIIGLGLGDEEDITIKGLKAI